MKKTRPGTVVIPVVFTAASLLSMPLTLANQTGEAPEMMDKPPDPEKAVASEYAEIKRRGTVEAFELFVARHPDHPLADDARRNLKRFRGN